MDTCHIVLANKSRLMRELIKRILAKTSALQIVGEAHDISELDALLHESRVHWVIVTLRPQDRISKELQRKLGSHPEISVLGISDGGDRAKVFHPDRQEKLFDNCSLDEVVTVLHHKPIRDGL